MLRIALAAVAALLLLTSSAGAAAKPEPPSCKAGEAQIRVLAKVARKARPAKRPRTTLACRALVRPAATLRPVDALRAAAIKPRDLQAALPKRLRKRLPVAAVQRLDRAFARRAATARAAGARPRAAGATGCDGPPTPGPAIPAKEVEGGTMTSSGGSWGEPGGPTWGTTTTLRGEIDSAGMTGSRTQVVKECTHWETCPDADGIVRGTFEHTFEETTVAAKDGASLTVTVRFASTARLTGHVGADGRAKTFDWVAEGLATTRGRAQVPGAKPVIKVGDTVRVTTTQTGADPRNSGRSPQPPTFGVWGLGGSILDGTQKGTIGSAVALATSQDGILRTSAAKALLGAEKVWYDDAACLDVAFDPQPVQASANAKVPVSVKVRAKDGADVASPFDAEAIAGTVAPASGTTAATVTWTAPEKVGEGTFPTFKVTAVSKRGRALGTHTAKGEQKPQWWRVTSEGAGEYGRHEERGVPYPQLWSEIHFRYRMVSMPVRLPSLDPAVRGLTGSEVAEVSGDASARRVDGGGTSTCASPLDGTGNLGRVAVQGGDGGFYLDVVPFFLLRPVNRTCPFDSMLLWMGPNVEPGMRATIHVTPAELESKDRIEKVVSEPGATADCRGARNAGNNDVPCTEQVRWQGRIVLERVPAPPGR